VTKRVAASLSVLVAGLAWAAATRRSPSEAAAVLDALMRGTGEEKAAPPADGTPRFVSDVRLVNLSVSVYGRDGRPVVGLKPEQFEVLENGAAQKVAAAGSEEVPFNLALLLDLSGSTIRDRPAMKEAARRFVGVTRPQDRIAVYALSGGQFQVICPLGGDHARTLEFVEGIPELTGSTPLYAAMILAWDEELARRSVERNAIIVISDGIDDSIEQGQSPVAFDRVRRAAAVMPALIYPIYLDSQNIYYGARARRQMEELAAASGGRLFSARSIGDLEPVYAQVAEELRSVYTLAYYPKNQNFDGRWRRVEVRVKGLGTRVRTRAGYYAR
jgi:Ca-activated chloride channel homolog